MPSSFLNQKFRKPWIGFLFLGWLFWWGCSPKTAAPVKEPPKAEKIPFQLVKHGQTRIDEYYWLRERENPKVLDYLKAENDYLAASMKPTEKLQNRLFHELVGRLQPNDETVPVLDNGYYYSTRFVKGKEYPLHVRRKGSLEAPEELMIDVNQTAAGHAFCSVSGLTVSPDNRFLAFGIDTVSRRLYTLYFKNLETGEILPDAIPNTGGSAAWASDNGTVFYAVKDSTLRPCRILRHVLGTDPALDVPVYEEIDNTFNVFASRSRSGRVILIGSTSTLSSEYRYIDADRPEGEFRVIQPRVRDLEYSVEHAGDRWFILTNDKARNFRLVEASMDSPGKEAWKEVVPHRPDVLLEDMDVFADHLALLERKDGLRRIRIIRRSDRSEHVVDLGEKTYVVYTMSNPRMDTDVLRFSYSSLTTPNSVFDYNMNTHEKILRKQDKVRGGFDSKNYMSDRLMALAPDSVEVPISLVCRQGTVLDGRNPLLLTGYGSYGYSSDAGFRGDWISLLDRGFIVAVAHVRGGSEMGRFWYEDGKLLKKKNTFTDFIACAERLVALKYTGPDVLCASGGSAGGLLMGAVVNMRPDLFRTVIAAVPWVDVVTTMLDESIPLTTSEYDEWGNPNDKTYYDYMLSYSPYDNVAAKAYPAMIVTTGLHDSQVQYWEPAKYVARLRNRKTDDRLLLLHTQMQAGHGGASGRFERYKILALEYAFLLQETGKSQ